MNIAKEIMVQFLFVLLPFVGFNVYYRDKTQNYSKNFITVACMLSLFLAMTFSLDLKEGYYFDARHIIMFFGMIFGGVQTGIILLLEFIAYRLYIGGEGKWIGISVLTCTFILSRLFTPIYKRANRKWLVSLLAGVMFSLQSGFIIYSFDPAYVLSSLYDHLVVIPLFYMAGIGMLTFLFDKAVSDKELFIRYTEKEKNEAMGHVAASLAHEVRNPITAVSGFLKLMRSASLPKNKMDEYIVICLEELNRMEVVISDYLAIGKPHDKQKIRIDLLHLLQNTIDVMLPYGNMHNVQIELTKPQEPVWIMADPDEMKQVIVNFVKNAIEACSEVSDGKVTLSVSLYGGYVRLSIKDNGIGMSREQQKRLGTIYFSTKSNGTGLGLTFSFQVIRALGGAVSVQSEPYGGSNFTIDIPLAGN
ncbi:sensor histidine kinase [Paenibacillus sp. N4]|uniref:ATP-binding protein n=1 Tax=Paenibacillus vietnamensis TaxID=2590547 RepID=UPI001CD08017|nr:sensor histidine kinase [Paenibacillus vietnamensis]MCA0756992.1 sensor histidine kinase [Paenibacillus vietnamensis]